MSRIVYQSDSLEHAGSQVAGDFSLVTRRINSFRARDCALAFGFLAVFSLVVATVFAALGAWLILPFAGLEAFVLYLAYAWVARHAADAESLQIQGDRVALAVSGASGVSRHEFNRLWARLVETRRHGELRLALRSHGREYEVGRYLDGGAKELLARELRSRLGGR